MSLRRIDTRTVSPARSACSALMAVRNEALRLPFVLDYHRDLGIDRFFIVDDHSTDGSREWLLNQPDCHVYESDESFRDSNLGMDWINALAHALPLDSWCLFIDADELLVYPSSETMKLPQFCAYLDATGSEGVESFLIDMYGRGPVRETHYAAGTSFLSVCPHFDRNYARRPRSRPDQPGEFVGGPRLRLFYPELKHVGPLGMRARRALRAARLHPAGRLLGLSRLGWGRALPPELRKVALLKVRPGLRWIGNHVTTSFKPAPVTAALLHFKFFSDFHSRAIVEAARGQHWDGAAEYARYCRIVAETPDLSFFHAGSDTFRSTAQLLALGHLRAPSDFPSFRSLAEHFSVAPVHVAQEATL